MNTQSVTKKVGFILIPYSDNDGHPVGVVMCRRGKYFGLPVLEDFLDPSSAQNDDERFDLWQRNISRVHGMLRWCSVISQASPQRPAEFAPRVDGKWTFRNDAGVREELASQFIFFKVDGLVLQILYGDGDIRIINPCRKPSDGEFDFTVDVLVQSRTWLDLGQTEPETQTFEVSTHSERQISARRRLIIVE